ncbi:HAMP domain-containing sensor histidine kinase [Shewanella sp. UCD-KL12]|uniref:sensor histidine kinase n=1 Tax=Shewanella sp. UCD-KL12 TaxID=1917163 RepID=UPI0021163BC1|nr:HAMP domain-containing sensor histidine kinase [Shewanella sp. UCD-KL12]
MSQKINSSTKTFTNKLSLYFNGIALSIGVLIFILSQAGLYWLEDEINTRNLNQSVDYAIDKFQRGAESPLAIGPNIVAYDSVSDIPKNLGQLGSFPIGFNAEITDDIAQDMFLSHQTFLKDGVKHSLYLTMEADSVELTSKEWRHINIASLVVMIILYLAFDFAISKLSKRLVQPVDHLSSQLKSDNKNKSFSVPGSSASEFTQLADTLNSYHQENQQLIKQEQAFARYASHELRTPLTVILGASKLLKRGGDPQFQTRQTERICKSAIDMQNTIDALLSLVKQEQSKENSQPRRLHAAEIERLLEYLKPLIDSKGLTLVLNLLDEPLIRPSEPVLKMLLSNLLHNAINATESGEITLTISSNLIEVRDSGSGLTEAEHSSNGHGLGLQIVDALCQRYHWDFSLVEASGGGCIASLSFQDQQVASKFT